MKLSMKLKRIWVMRSLLLKMMLQRVTRKVLLMNLKRKSLKIR